MNIFVTGISGFIGQRVKKIFEMTGHIVYSSSKESLILGGEELEVALSKADAVVNLAGAPIFGRWTEKRMIEILESRRVITRNLVNAINANSKKPDVLINASAVGIYRPDSYCDEYSDDYANNFLSRVVRAWEGELNNLEKVRKVILRFGIVIGKDGGVMEKLQPFINSGVGFIMGNGKQEFPLIHVQDIGGFMLYAMQNQNVEGIYNMVIPNSVTYRQFTKALGIIHKQWTRPIIPSPILSLALGDSAVVLTESAHVIPKRLIESGYHLKYSTIEEVINAYVNED
ncbi:MAG: TIGR01777 family oxidoreductase [Odoribacter sp.]|nr:TIGR01777 family oxidoreductase [Odoribacter sp.]